MSFASSTDTAEMLETYLGVRRQSTTEATLRLLIWTGLQLTGAEEGSLLVVDEAAGDLRFAMTLASRGGSADAEAVLIGQRVPLGAGITGLAAASREVQIGAPTFRDVKQADRVGGGPEAVIAAPMLAGDELVGVITAVSFEPGKRFSSDLGRLFGGFAVIAGVVVDQERRLGRLEAAQPAASLDPSHRRALAAIDRLASRRPDAMEAAADVIERLERLAVAPR